MSLLYDPYDPEELRRRQAISPETMDETPRPDTPQSPSDLPVVQAAMQEEPEESGDAPTAPPTVSGPASSKLTDAQQRYKDTLGQMPDRANYKPSGWRRFGAALAGGLAGVSDAKTGMQVASSINNAPFDRAQQDWASRVNRGALETGLDKDVASQDIARQRAAAYGQSAQARTDVARSTEAWRNFQERNAPYHPKTEEEALRLEAAKHVPPKPTAFEQYSKDPNGYRNYLKDVNAGKVQPLDFNQRAALIAMQEKGRNERNAANNAARRMAGGKPIMASPKDQGVAEDQAVQQLLREHPEYAASVDTPTVHQGGFLGMGGTDVKGKSRIRDMNEVTAGKSGTEASLARALHSKFLSEVAKRKQGILGTSKNVPGDNSSDWDIQEEDDQ